MSKVSGNSEIQAVLFHKPMSSEQAQRWLRNHNLVPMKRVHKTENYLRYRIRDPSEFSHFATKKKGNISLVIGFK